MNVDVVVLMSVVDAKFICKLFHPARIKICVSISCVGISKACDLELGLGLKVENFIADYVIE